MDRLLKTSTVRYCRPCGEDVVARARPRGTGVGLVLVTLSTLALIGFSALIGPFIMFTAPLILLSGFAIGPLVSLIDAPDVCPLCARELRFASRLEATHHANAKERAVRHSRTTAARATGDMKAA